MVRRLAIWSLLFALLFGLALPAAAAPQVAMSVQAANEGRVKQNGWVTVVVDLVNQGGDIAGELVVETDTEVTHPQYVVPYSLPAGGRKRIPVSLTSSGNWPVQVKLYAGGALVETKSVNLTWVPPQSLFAGVLSSDELGIPAINQLQTGQGSPQVVRLTAETLPDQGTLLNDFNLIALSRFDTASLTAEQLRALEVWVGRGGTLLLAGGPEWRRTFGPLPEALVPVAVTGVQEVSLAPLGSLAGSPLAERGAVSVAQVTQGQALVSSEGVPLVVSAQVGAGRVVYLAFDPGLNPVIAWPGQAALYSRLVGHTGLNQGWGGDPQWQMQEALQRLPDWALPGVWTVALVLIGYLLLVGPTNYVILKRVDRREWGWATVPLISLLFVALVYFMGFGRFEPLVSHLITVTEIVPGTESATMSTHLGIYAPSRKQISVALPEARLVRPYTRGPGRSDAVSARVVAGEKTTVQLMSLSNFAMSGFHLERDVPVAGGLTLVEATLDGNVITGRVYNGTAQAMAGVVVAYGSNAKVVGDLPAGQTSEPFSLVVGQTTDPMGKPMFGGGWIDPYSWDGISSMGPEGRDTAWSRRQSILGYLTETLASRPAGGLVLVGWTDKPIADPGVPDLGKVVQGANLVYSVLSLPTGGDSSEIPPGMIFARPEDGSGATWTPGGYYLAEGVHSFTLLLPPIDPAKVAYVELDLGRPMPAGMGQVLIKNQVTQEWVPLTEVRTAWTAWQSYVSSFGLMELRYEVTRPDEVATPTVSVRGVSR